MIFLSTRCWERTSIYLLLILTFSYSQKAFVRYSRYGLCVGSAHCIYLANAIVLVTQYFAVVAVCGRGQCLCVSATAATAFNNIKSEVENVETLEVDATGELTMSCKCTQMRIYCTHTRTRRRRQGTGERACVCVWICMRATEMATQSMKKRKLNTQVFWAYTMFVHLHISRRDIILCVIRF